MKKHYSVFLLILCFFVFFAGTIDLNSLLNYASQPIPNYINEDNTPNNNPITDEGATLGRVLFYDTNLSLTNTVSCASCHQQSHAFGDPAVVSVGHNGGLTGRHSPRLSSARFGEDPRFFWDERAANLEQQSTMPIQDHVEMGFSGTDGDPSIDSLINRLDQLSYYDELFNLAYGDQLITEQRMQNALAQFVRSIQSFDTKYDIGRAQVNNNDANFPNFTTEENNGKALFMSNNATGCNRCHRAPEFDIDPNSDNNGVVGVAGSPGAIDITNTRSPSLRDLTNAAGIENGPFMHDGSLSSLLDVIDHYDNIPNVPGNTNLDNRLNGNGGNLNLSNTEKSELVAFLKTLGGSSIYTDERWSDPFDASGNITILNGSLPVELVYFEVHLDESVVELEWETASEINNEGFEVLYSTNSVDWEYLGYVTGNNEASVYDFRHLDPVSGANYYRLKQIDLDGLFELSDIKSAYLELEEDLEIAIYPNPTQDYIKINAAESYGQLSILDMNGNVVLHADFEESLSIDLSQMASGSYLVKLIDESSKSTKVERVVKF